MTNRAIFKNPHYTMRSMKGEPLHPQHGAQGLAQSRCPKIKLVKMTMITIHKPGLFFLKQVHLLPLTSNIVCSSPKFMTDYLILNST